MRSLGMVLRGAVCGFLAVAAGFCGQRAEAQGSGSQGYSLGAPVLAVPAAGQPVFVATADVNGDGIADLVYVDAGATPTASTTHVLLGDGKGGFKESATLQTAGNSVAIGDLLGNGRVDIGWIAQHGVGSAPSGPGYAVYYAAGDGDGTFAPAQFIVGGGGPNQEDYSYLVAGKLDNTYPVNLIGVDTAGGVATVIGYDPQSHLCAYVEGVPLAAGAGPASVASLTSDGHMDLIVDSLQAASAQVILGTGTGITTIPMYAYDESTFAPSAGVRSLLLQDFNQDGILDMAAESSSGRIAIYPGHGDGMFQSTSIGGTASPDDTRGDGGHLIAAADLNGDGVPDLLTFSPLGVSVELGTASASFTYTGSYPAGAGAGANGQFVTADFNGDGALDVAMDAPGGIVILYGTPANVNSLTASPEPSTYGSAFTLTASVGAGATGTVTFEFDQTTLGMSNVQANGTATWQVPAGNSYAAGAHTLTALYLATGHALAQALTGTHTIDALVASSGTVNAGGATAFEAAIPVTATINPASGSPAPTGTILFSISGTPSPIPPVTAPLVNGTATYTFAAVTPNTGGNPVLPGTNTVTAVYSGDSNYGPVTLTAAHMVNLGVTTVTLTPAPPTAVLAPSYFYGQPINGFVNITPQDTQFPLKGTWEQLSNGVGVPGCTALPIVGSECPYGYPTLLDAGNYVFVEQYNGGPANGDPVNGTGDSAPYSFVVQADTTAVSSLISSANPANFGSAVTFTVTLAGNAAVPTGQVQFLDGPVAIGSGTLNAQGQASFTTSSLAIATHPITAAYAGNIDFLPITSGVLNQVIEAVPVASGVTLTSNINPSLVGTPVTFTAAVTSAGAPVTAGVVSFVDGGTSIGTGVLNAQGQATFTTSSLAVGTHQMTAMYAGGPGPAGSTIGASTSPVYQQVVSNGIGDGFTLKVTPNPLTVKPGDTGILLVQASGLTGFLEPVTLSCTGLDKTNQFGCLFVEPTLPGGGGSSMLELTTVAPYPCNGSPTAPYAVERSAAGLGCGALPGEAGSAESAWQRWMRRGGTGAGMLAALGLLWPVRRRQRRFGVWLALVALTGLVGLSGCGNCTNLGTRPGTYHFTVVATSGGSAPVVHAVAVTVKVIDP